MWEKGRAMDNEMGRRVNFTENWVGKGSFYFSLPISLSG